MLWFPFGQCERITCSVLSIMSNSLVLYYKNISRSSRELVYWLSSHANFGILVLFVDFITAAFVSWAFRSHSLICTSPPVFSLHVLKAHRFVVTSCLSWESIQWRQLLSCRLPLWLTSDYGGGTLFGLIVVELSPLPPPWPADTWMHHWDCLSQMLLGSITKWL